MTRRPITEIRVDEHDREMHESWLLIRANHRTSTGSRLFDSEIPHQRTVAVTITRCSRSRDLHHDHLMNEQILLEMEMSQAQWGAFVSSFGQGTGVPATLRFLTGQGHVPESPVESRLAESMSEVRGAAEASVEDLRRGYARIMAAFETGGRRALREALTTFGHQLNNAPKNMEFAAESLAGHAENVVTKARADIEGMVLAAAERGELAKGDVIDDVIEVEQGESPDDR